MCYDLLDELVTTKEIGIQAVVENKHVETQTNVGTSNVKTQTAQKSINKKTQTADTAEALIDLTLKRFFSNNQ